MKSVMPFVLILCGFLEVDRKQYVDVDRRSALTVEIREPNPCQPETPRNRQIMDSFLSTTTPSDIRTSTGTGHLNASQIEVLQENTVACDSLLSYFDTTLLQMVSDTTEKMYDVTFYSAGTFYFVVQTLHESSNPNRITFGLSFHYTYDSNLNFIEGYSF